MERKRNIRSMQALRGLAFLGIFTSHCDISDLGAWGVSIFFAMSGFLMIYSYESRLFTANVVENFRFALKKISKLYPLHIFMFGLALPPIIIRIIKYNTIEQRMREVMKILLNILLLQAWFPNIDIYWFGNAVAWFLSDCLFLYFVFPWLLFFIRPKENKTIIKESVVVYILLIVAAVTTTLLTKQICGAELVKWITYICPLFRMGDFFFGCVLGKIFMTVDLEKISVKRATFYEVLVFLMLLFCHIVLRNRNGMLTNTWYKDNLIYTGTSIITVFLFAINKGAITKILSNRFLVFCGNISAYAFLIHQMVIRYFDAFSKKVLNQKINIGERFLICFTVTIISSLIWKISVDKFNQYRQRSRQCKLR